MLQAKVQQLYKLDQLLQEESGTLHSLQQNKVIINLLYICSELIIHNKNYLFQTRFFFSYSVQDYM